MNPVRQEGDDVRELSGFPYVDKDGPHGMGSLMVRFTEGHMLSLWKPTPEELAQLNAGGFVVLSLMGTRHPPVSMGTQLE